MARYLVNRSVLFLLLTICYGYHTAQAREKLQGYVECKERSAILETSSKKLQDCYRGATVTVYIAGTDTLATIYSDDARTPKANPFMAEPKRSHWSFYADNGSYEIRFSKAGIITPFSSQNQIVSDASEPYNIQNFGGKGDDSTDNITALNKVLAALGASSKTVVHNGGTIYFPAGIYRYSLPINVGDRGNIVFQGAGSRRFHDYKVPNTSLIYTGAERYGISTNNIWSPGFTLRNLHVGYSNPSFMGDLIVVRSLGFLAEDVSFGDNNASGKRLYNARSLVALHNAHSYLFEKCTFSFAQRGIYLPVPDKGEGTANHLRVNNSQFYDLTFAGIDHDPVGPPLLGANITGSLFNPVKLVNNAPQYGIRLTALGFNISGCNFLPSNIDTLSWSEAALRLHGTGKVDGCAISTANRAIQIVAGQVTITGAFINAAQPIDHQSGLLIEKGNSFQFYARARLNASSYRVGELVRPTASNGFIYRATQGGNAGAHEPTWPTAPQRTVRDGEVVWTALPATAVLISETGDGGQGEFGPDRIESTSPNFAYSYYNAKANSASNFGIVNYDPYNDSSANGVFINQGLIINNLRRRTIQKNSSYRITQEDTQCVLGNVGATGKVTFALPQAELGLEYTFINFSAQEIEVVAANGDSIRKVGTPGVTSLSNAAGEAQRNATLKLRAIDNIYWMIEAEMGTWR